MRTGLDLLPAVTVSISALLLGVALMRGAMPERLLAAILFGGGISESSFVWLEATFGSRHREGTCLLLDFALFCMILGIALLANRRYPLWLGALQLVTLACHLAEMWVMSGPRPHAIMQWVPFGLQLIVMAAGLLAYTTSDRQRPSWTQAALKR